MKYPIYLAVLGTVCGGVVHRQVVQPVVKKRAVVVQKQAVVDDHEVVVNTDSDVLFFVSPEYRSSVLYPERQGGFSETQILQLRQLIGDAVSQQLQQQSVVQPRPQIDQSPKTYLTPPPRWTDPPATPTPGPRSAVGMTCSYGANGTTCHSGPQPAASFSLEDSGELSHFSIAESIARIVDGTMPKDRQLGRSEQWQLIEELVKRKTE